jgi:Tfp pilus assembly protein PilF
MRGRVLIAKGETDKAIEEFDRALKLKPNSGDALTARGAAWLKKKDYARSLADIEKAMSLDHADLESYLIRAGVYEAQGKTDLAIADLRTATQFAPRTVFETLAQAEAKKRISRLTKATPCPSAGDGGTCL